MVATQAIQVALTKKQAQASKYLADERTREVLFGGGAGGAKSWLGCYWSIKNCLKYPGCRGLMGRSVLKTLKQTTLNTFFEVSKSLSLKSGEDYSYNEQKGEIRFYNDSVILLKDLFLYPRDPEFDSLGSLEITFAFIDECNQVVKKAKDIVGSRIRYKLDEYGVSPKLLMSCNPAKNWVYSEFYKPWREGTLTKDKAFVQALAKDNPFISSHYIDNLRRLPKNSLERLLHGNWEYDDDPDALIEFDAILDLFENIHVAEDKNQKYITADIATQGSDRFVVAVWHGFVLADIAVIPKCGGKEIIEKINELRTRHAVRPSNIVYDADGIGGFIGGEGGFIERARAFHNGAKALPYRGEEELNYENLKTQCYYHLAENINAGAYWVKAIEDETLKEQLKEELEQVKRRDADKDGKIKLKRKEDIKQDLGRSPDLSDVMAMREFFELDHKRLPQML